MDAQLIKMTSEAVLGGMRIPEGAVIKLDGDSVFYNGQKLQLGLSTADVHDPTELPTYLAGYSNEEFRHAEICQIIPVDKDQDKYRTFSSNAAFLPVTVKTDDDANIAEVKVTTSLTQYTVQPRRLGAFIPDTVRNQANPNYNVEFVHMERAARAINMDLELDVVGPTGLLTTAANWASGFSVTNALGFQWGGASGIGANSDPIADVRTRLLKSRVSRNASFWFNQRVAGFFLDHPKTRDYMRATIGDSAQQANVRAVFEADGEQTIDFKIPGLGVFHVCCAKYAVDTVTEPDFIMPDCLLMVVQPPGVPTNGEKIATSYNFRRRGPNGNGFGTREVRIEQRGAGGLLVIAEEASIPTLTANNIGGLVLGLNQ